MLNRHISDEAEFDPDRQGTGPVPAGESDGPYLVAQGEEWRVLTIDASGRAVTDLLPKGAPLTVPGAAGLPEFRVDTAVAPFELGPASLALDPDVPLIVLGDTHGEYGIVARFLLTHSVIDDQLNWAFGAGQLIVLGDVFDRGPHQLPLLWLLYKLAAQADEYGGRVHLLLGNHDVMVLRGDLRYLHRRHRDTASRLGYQSLAGLFGPDSLLGAWLRKRPTVLRLGDLLFVHGGIGPELLAMGLTAETINAQISEALDLASSAKSSCPAVALATDAQGPLWYRGYFNRGKARAQKVDVVAALAHFGVKRIFVGHTVVARARALFGGRVIATHVYPRIDKKSGEPIFEAVARRNGRWYRLNAQGETKAFPLREG